MNGLQMKYFVMKPGGKDAYADASRKAMRQYARSIFKHNPKLANELLAWTDREKRLASGQAAQEEVE